MNRLAELVIMLVVSQWPIFAFAASIDRDEYLKAASASATIAGVVYLRWRKQDKEEPPV